MSRLDSFNDKALVWFNRWIKAEVFIIIMATFQQRTGNEKPRSSGNGWLKKCHLNQTGIFL
ncbi:hypothetical protein [Mucilaginibacter lacusdianchii]|uniref:hypothetical protein n=1 Tax=Mucilaginibacter lacusdianchii TaxID=2684211 RepID=UPI00131C3EF3|nr:hypothetical protein [Mucilaginibacter sp. JXJ CY 39]